MDVRTDQELVLQALSGDKHAFGRLAERYYAEAQRIALRMVRREDIAEELAQEALLEAYLSLNRLKDAFKFKSWLYGIVLNLCRSYVRDHLRRNFSGLPDEESEAFDLSHFFSNSPNPEKVAEEREINRLVLDAIEDLPGNQKEAVLLFYYEYLDIREIADLLGVSAGAVKMRLNRARGQLRDHLLQRYVDIEPEAFTPTRRIKMVKVTVIDVVKQDQKYIVMLKDEASNRVLPIWIGPFEGQSIAMGVRGFHTSRPMTFNFISSILQALQAELEEIRIETLKDETFYGVARLRSGEMVKEVDARPSDVLALAVRTGSPIYVAEDVMDRAAKDMQEFEGPAPTGEGMEAILKEMEAIMQALPPKQTGSPSEACPPI